MSVSSAPTHLVRAQQALAQQPSDAPQAKTMYPFDLPDRSEIGHAAKSFHAEWSGIAYILHDGQLSTCLDNIYTYQLPCTYSTIVIIFLVLALGNHCEPYFEHARRHFDYALEEHTLETVQAFMLMVGALVLYVRNIVY